MKTILTLAAAVAFSASVFAQGTVTMANNSSTLITLNGGAPAPSSLTFELYAGLDAGSLVAQTPTAGTFASNGGRIASTTITLSNVGAGVTGWFQIYAWASTFATYADALANNGAVGNSTVFSAVTGGAGEPPSLPTSLAGLYQGFDVAPIPEPTTMALLGIGAASLLVFRRRK